MSATLTIRDESPGQASYREWSLEVPSERISVRELIRSRVYQEVMDFNQRKPNEYSGLVQPADAELTPSGFRLGKPRPIDWREQFQKAVDAFEANQVLVLVDGRQAERLDEEFVVHPGVEITFLRLTLLVGG